MRSMKRFANDEGGIRTDTREIFSTLPLQKSTSFYDARPALRGSDSGIGAATGAVSVPTYISTCSLAAATANTSAVSHSKVCGSRACRSRVRFDSARAVSSQSLARDVDARIVARVLSECSLPLPEPFRLR